MHVLGYQIGVKGFILYHLQNREIVLSRHV